MKTEFVEAKFDKNARWILTEKYDGIRNEKLEKDILRVQNGEPIDYVIGWLPFLGCRIDLSFRLFIPRTETEFWTKNAIEEAKLRFRNRAIKVLDIFAGSGSIGIATLKHIPRVKVDFAEIDKNFCQQIEKNLALNQIVLDRSRIICSDIFSDICGKYDLILANPPYVPLARKDAVARSVREYEPPTAVFGGQDGLNVIRRFLGDARQYLNPKGIIWMEFDAPEKDKINQIVEESGYSGCEFLRDQFGEWRTLKIVV